MDKLSVKGKSKRVESDKKKSEEKAKYVKVILLCTADGLRTKKKDEANKRQKNAVMRIRWEVGMRLG